MSAESVDDDAVRGGDQMRAAIRRAGIHFLRAGYEVLAGVSAFLEELGTQREGDEDRSTGPTRIELED